MVSGRVGFGYDGRLLMVCLGKIKLPTREECNRMITEQSILVVPSRVVLD